MEAAKTKPEAGKCNTVPQKLVLCCDGTGNQYGKENTNVVYLYELLKENWGDGPQVKGFYDPGVGTGGPRGNWLKRKAKQIYAQATGKGVQKNIEDAYRWLMNEYQEGDEIYLFGFSRGAFTVRSLAGMLHKVGLLRPGMDNMIGHASEMYNTRENDPLAEKFKKTFSRSCPVHFIGVWDTVDSRYLSAGRDFHDATLNPEVKYGHHALAIDERRGSFPPCPWDEAKKDKVDCKDEDKPSTGQTIEQVWFPGVHSDVGGSYPDRRLSNGALHWMAKKAIACGLPLEMQRLEEEKHKPDPYGQLHDSYGFGWFLQEVLMKYCGKRLSKDSKKLAFRLARTWEKSPLCLKRVALIAPIILAIILGVMLSIKMVWHLLVFLGVQHLPELLGGFSAAWSGYLSTVLGFLEWASLSGEITLWFLELAWWLVLGVFALLYLYLCILAVYVVGRFCLNWLSRKKSNALASGMRIKDNTILKNVPIIPKGSKLHSSVRKRRERQNLYCPENLLEECPSKDEAPPYIYVD